MATVLFVMKYPLHFPENLKAKFDGQMAAVRALGHEACAIGWDMEGMWLIGDGNRSLLRKNAFTNMPGYDHTKIFFDLMAATRQVLTQKKIDLIYFRYMPTFGSAVKTLRLLKKQGGKLVLEFPTYPREGENRRSWLRRPVFAYTDRVLENIHPMVDLYTAIGEDCGGELGGKPAMNILNGVDVDDFPLHVPNEQTQAVHLLGVASMMASHGYDRILRSMAAYKGDVEACFHMVGADGDGSLTLWKALVKELGLEHRVVFHGPLYGQALNEVVGQADIGIGALAMHRFGLFSGTPLKCREYMARGLPFVYAGEDAAMPEDPRFCLSVSNDEGIIDMEEIIAFAQKAKQAQEVPALMRAYARENMSWEGIMGGVLKRVMP